MDIKGYMTVQHGERKGIVTCFQDSSFKDNIVTDLSILSLSTHRSVMITDQVLGCVYLKWDEVNAALKCCNQCGAICRTTQDGHDCINDINQCTTIQIPSPTPSRSEPTGRRGNGYLL
eukprot:scaffold3087_cov288-Chaetoceros_neogracile.AAC.12